MGLAQAAIGVGATVLAKALSLKVWSLFNLKTNETVVGQFPAEDVEREISVTYASFNAFGRQSAFLQFINGETQTLKVHSRFFKTNMFDESPVDKVEKLISWTMIDAKASYVGADAGTGRSPPLLTFSLGDGLGLQMDVVLEKLSGIRYKTPNALGGIREVEFTMEFLRWNRSSFFNPVEVLSTHYVRSKQGDYQELLAAREYGDPMVGVALRHRTPGYELLDPGDVLALPAIQGIRSDNPAPGSIVLSRVYNKKKPLYRAQLDTWFKKRNNARTKFWG
jgi:hypothetical protein